MAGRKGHVSRSLEFSKRFFGCPWPSSWSQSQRCFFSYSYAFREAIELQDDQLRQVAAWTGGQRFSTPPSEVAGPTDADPESRFIVLTAEPQSPWQPEGAAPGLSANAPDGLQTVAIAGVPRWFVIGARVRGLRIAVGQQTAVRNEIANKSALRAVAPLLSLIVLLPLVIGATVRRMLRPLKSIADDLDAARKRTGTKSSTSGCRSKSSSSNVVIKRLPRARRRVRRRPAAIPGGRST